MSFSLYQVWLYMAVFSAAKTFGNDGNILSFAPLTEANHLLLVYVFLGVSAALLIALGLLRKRVVPFFASRRSVAVAGVLGTIGTLMLQLGAGASAGAVVVAGACMGICAAVFVILLGNAFARFEFATCVLDSAVSAALGFICAVAFVNWVPSPASGFISALMPVLMSAAFWKKTHSEPGSEGLGVDMGHLSSYLRQFVASMALYGIVAGALRVVCADRLLSSGQVTIELVLGVSCIASVLLFVAAIAASRKETLWDSMFRTVAPAVFLGLACMVALPGDLNLVASFFVGLGFVSFISLIWVLLACLARSMNGTSIFIFGVGYGVMQALSCLGYALANNLASASAAEMLAVVSMAGEHAPIQADPLYAAYNLAVLALVLCVAMSFAYAISPRYLEMRGILSGFLGEMLRNSAHAGAPEGGAPSTSDVAAPEGDVTDAAASSPAAGAPAAGIGADGADAADAADGMAEAAAGRAAAGAASGANAPDEGAEGDPDGQRAQHGADAQAAQEAQPAREDKGSFVRRCEELSEAYALSAREKEVFFLLAKGHNAAFITDKLCVSKSTAKTHINHIYKKMDIHTQQELLTMVEDRARGPLGADVDREALREALRRANEEGSLERNPSGQIKRDYIGF